MTGEGISQLPVVDDQDHVVGSIRERTISNQILTFGKEILGKRVSEVLEESFPQYSASSITIIEIRKLFLEQDAILLTEKGKIVGIITKADIIAHSVQ